MKNFVTFLFFASFVFSFLYAETPWVSDFKGRTYRFHGNLQYCDNLPDDETRANTQGTAHFGENLWFLTSTKELNIYDGFFTLNNEETLLDDSASFGNSQYTYAKHLGDIDFDQATSKLYIPLEKLKMNGDLSGYSIYTWNNANRTLTFNKLVVLETTIRENESSAPYAAYNSGLLDHKAVLFPVFFFTFCHKGGVICISEVIDISPGNLHPAQHFS